MFMCILWEKLSQKIITKYRNFEWKWISAKFRELYNSQFIYFSLIDFLCYILSLYKINVSFIHTI